MDPVKKNKSLLGIIIFLLISNIAMLVFFLALGNNTKKEHNANTRKDMISNFLKKDVGFDQQQMDSYEQIHKDHFEKMRPFFDSLHASKDNFYNLLYVEAPDSVVNKAAAVIGENQISLDIQMFRHFKNIRSLCKPEQLPKFDSLFKTVLSHMTQHRKPDPKAKP